MAKVLTANELKTKGITRLEEVTSSGEEAIISVRGKHRFVVVSIEQYNHLRECELEAAIAETERDLADGNVIQEPIEDHIKRITSA